MAEIWRMAHDAADVVVALCVLGRRLAIEAGLMVSMKRVAIARVAGSDPSDDAFFSFLRQCTTSRQVAPASSHDLWGFPHRRVLQSARDWER